MITQQLATVFKDQLDTRMTLAEAFELFDSRNLIAHGELTEQAVSMASGVDQCAKNTPGIDLVNGLQIKYAQTNYATQAYSGTLKGHISIKNHRETILAVVTETETRKQYYFVFPYSAYRYLNGNTFTVPFSLMGTPRRTNWTWDYEVDGWAEFIARARKG